VNYPFNVRLLHVNNCVKGNFLEKHLRLSYLYDVFPAGMREQSLSNTISCEYL